MNLYSSFALLCLLGRVAVQASPTLRGDATVSRSSQRELDVAPFDICQRTDVWDWQGDGYKHETLGCLDHDTCAKSGFSDRSGAREYPSCCLYPYCICGSAQALFTPGVNHCGIFGCTSDDHCWPGKCGSNNRCNFDNIKPCCETDTDCGSGKDSVCRNGYCYRRGSNGVLRPSGCPNGVGGVPEKPDYSNTEDEKNNSGDTKETETAAPSEENNEERTEEEETPEPTEDDVTGFGNDDPNKDDPVDDGAGDENWVPPKKERPPASKDDESVKLYQPDRTTKDHLIDDVTDKENWVPKKERPPESKDVEAVKLYKDNRGRGGGGRRRLVLKGYGVST